jgi:hypothetical protein
VHCKGHSSNLQKSLLLFIAALLFSVFSGALLSAEEKPIQATIDASKTGAPISKYIYGQCLEHIGGIVNSNIWAEMLDDRKFYYPINSHPPAEPQGPSWRRITVHHWTPVGADEFVLMDTERAYVGDHSPMVKLSSSEPHGIQQAGLALRKGKSYLGRVILAGTPGTTVKINLMWGSAANDRQTVVISKVGNEYRKFPLTFQAQGDSDDGHIEIVSTGAGSFHIGAISLMPANNVRGFRAEVIAALKQLHSGVYRWPGGNFVSGHEWRNAKLGFFPRAQLASAAAWSPDPKNPPLYLDLPNKDGQPQPDVLAKWAANAPLAFIDQYIGSLRKCRAISIDVGDQDGLRVDTAKLHDVLDKYGIANNFEQYQGTHTSRVADRFQNHVMPFFSQNLCFKAGCK